MSPGRVRRPAGVRRAWIGAVFAITIVLAACASGAAAPSLTTQGSSPAAATSGGPAPSAGPITTASQEPSSVGSVAVDPDLLQHVPDQVDGLQLTYDPETTARVVNDPALARDASGLAIAIAVEPGTSAAAELTVVSVVRLRDPSVDDAWFRAYRDSYDQAACSSAGGVSGHAQATIAGRQVFIGTGAGGAVIYHVRLADRSIIVSALSVGSRHLGEKVMEGIKP